MKKNVMMRLASFLLVAVLVSTCAISGTYAKYVTTGSGEDNARVAKWGVQISTWTNSMFANAYAEEAATDASITNSVEASQEVVAPGTKNTESISFSLSGTPEVAVKLDVVVKGTAGADMATDVVLPADTYKDWTQAPYNGTFTLDKDYHPVVFTLMDGTYEVKKGTLADIEKYLEEVLTAEYGPNTNLAEINKANGGNGTYTLSWEWAYGNFDGITTNDKADTYLGNVIAGIQSGSAGISTAIDFTITITATQID